MAAHNPSKSILFLFFLLFLAKPMFWDLFQQKEVLSGGDAFWYCVPCTWV